MRTSALALAMIAALAVAAACGPCAGCRTLSALVIPEGEADYSIVTNSAEVFQ